MGQKISLEEKFALDVVDRLCQKIGRMRGVEQGEIMKRDILKKRKLKHIPANKVICEGGGKHSPFLLIRGKIRVGDYDVTRPGIFCMECAYGFPAISKITVVEETDIFKFNPNADLKTAMNTFHHMIMFCPIFPIKVHNATFKSYLFLKKHKNDHNCWRRGIASALTDSILDLSSPDEQFDVAERPDYQQYIEQIMTYFNDAPRYISVPPDSDPIVLQRTGEVPTNSWLLAMGTIDIRDQDGDNAEDDCMTDSDVSCVLESETCTQTPSTKDYIVNPGSIVVSLNRLTLVAVQFMKTFNMEPHDAICAADQSYVVSLAPGERIDESKWFKGIIFMGKLKLVALPPGRASEAETVRRSTLMLRKDSEFTTNLTNITLDIPLPNEMKPRRSCRIATILDNAFEKCGPFDEFQAITQSLVLISTGCEQTNPGT